jgi:hypothetical protein
MDVTPYSPPATAAKAAAERPWRIALSLLASSTACAIGILCWWQTAPGLWELATFAPSGPIRPIALFGYLLLTAAGGFFVGTPLSALASNLSEHSAAQAAAVAGMIAAGLPSLNFLLFWVIIILRDIELGT